MAKAQVKIQGLTDLLAKLDGNELIGEPWTAFVTDVSTRMASRFKSAAPTKSGGFAGSIQWRAQKKPIPKWSKVVGGFPAKNRWPFMLDAGARKIQGGGVSVYHFSRSGSPTRGWIKNILNETKGFVDAGLAKVTKEIEKRWERKQSAETG